MEQVDENGSSRSDIHRASEVAQAVREQVRAALCSESAQMRDQGRHPYAGGWYTQEEITVLHRALRHRDRWLVIELVVWEGLGFVLLLVLYGLFLFLFIPE